MMAAQHEDAENGAPKASVVGAALEVEDENSADEADRMLGGLPSKSRSIADALDNVPLGRFHALLALRQAFVLLVFATSGEVAAYAFGGLQKELGATSEDLATFAAAYSVGGMVGTVVGSALSDGIGRRTTFLIAAPVAGSLHFCMAFATSMRVLILLRCLQAGAGATVLSAAAPWYSEFLPTRRRGQLLALCSLGWPVGRFTMIVVAEVTDDAWRPLIALGGVGFFMILLLMASGPESPRYLVYRERFPEAHQVLGRMYATNGGSWDSKTKLSMSAASAEKTVATANTAARLRSIICGHACTISFSISIFAALSASTVLIDTYGPSVFKQLIAPESPVLPHRVLQLFNAGDLCGIIVAALVADRIGRRGSFYVGFFVQGSLFALMAFAGSLVPSQKSGFAVLMGTLASSCRCFGWEAAHFWTLEAFPTDLRATASGFAMTCMRVFSIISLEVSGKYVDQLQPETCIKGFALFLGCGGLIVIAAMPFETAGRIMNEGDEGKASNSVDE